ncbi:MAG: phage terminase large subunit [Acidobacteriota bacterium]|nr:phage terminase large subunit [Acidobacteriota bacterium]
MTADPRQALGLARQDLGAFAAAVFPGFEFPPHLRLVADELEEVERGQQRRTVVVIPPRHGKSLLASTIFPAWFLGRDPSRSVIFATYSEELSTDFGRRVRNIVADPLFRAIFPRARIAADAASVHRFALTDGGNYYATGRGGAITGRGADLLLLDDLVKDAEEARSEAVRKSVREFFERVAFTRLQPGGAVVLVGTRWNLADLIGVVLEEHAGERWRVVNLPALAIEDEPPPLSRRAGDPLWPERFPAAVLSEIRAVLGSAAFETLYQGNPVAAEGQMFRRDWWRFYDPARSPQFSRVTLSLDTAFKATQTADYSAATVWGETEAGFFLLDAWRGRVEFPELKRQVSRLATDWSPHAVLVEDKASGQSLVQELRAGSSLPVLAVKVTGDKVARAAAATPTVEAGRVYLPSGVSWLDDFLAELSSFPAGKHDDLVDTVTQFLNWARGEPEPGRFLFASAYSGPRGRDLWKHY